MHGRPARLEMPQSLESGRTKGTLMAFVRPTPSLLDFRLLRDLQCVIHLDPKISNCALQFGMAKQ